jgi:hypothetical protein
MNTVAPFPFPRLAPLLKVRTVLRRRVAYAAQCLPANPSTGSGQAIESIEDTLALGWTEEQIQRQRQTSQILNAAAAELDAGLEEAVKICSEHEVGTGALLLFTRLVAARGCLTQALERTALTVLAIAFFTLSVMPDRDDGFARRAGRRRGRTRDDVVCLCCGETGGEGEAEG